MEEASNNPNIHHYDWPSDAHDQKWRHITNYCIFEDNSRHVGIKNFTKNKSCKLTGYLLAHPSHVTRSALRVNLTVSYRLYSAIV